MNEELPKVRESNVSINELSKPRSRDSLSAGNTNHYSAKVDASIVRERLGVDTYDHPKAFIREYVSNSETSCLRACKLKCAQTHSEQWVQDHNTREIIEEAKSNGYEPVIEFQWDETERELIIQDNGIGFTREVFEKVYVYYGNSGVHGDTDTTGKFGMGALSVDLVLGKDMDGCFVLENRSRETNDAFTMYGNPGGYDELPQKPEEGFYGARFTIPVSEEVDSFHPYDWLQEFAEFSRIPVIFTHYKQNELIADDEIGGKSFKDIYPDAPVMIERPGEFSLMAGPSAGTSDQRSYVTRRQNRVLLHSIPIDANKPHHTDVSEMYNYDLRIENEHGLIVSGEHKGQLEQDVHHLSDDDVVLPEPTNDRDRLKQNKKFWNWLHREVNKGCQKIAGEKLKGIQTTDDVLDLVRNHNEDYQLVTKTVASTGGYGVLKYENQFTDHIQKNDTYPNISDDVSEALWLMNQSVQEAPKGSHGITRKKGRSTKDLHDVLKDSSENIYVGKTINKEKCDILWHNDSNAKVIWVGGKNCHLNYQNSQDLGFKLLKDIPTANQITKDDDPDWEWPQSIIDKKKEKKQKKQTKEDKELTIHYNTRMGTNQVSAEEAYERYDDDGKLVIFGPDSEESLSDNRWIGNVTHFANCKTQKTFDYLTQAENVVEIGNFIEGVLDNELRQPNGTINTKDIPGMAKQLLIVLIRKEAMDKYCTQAISESITKDVCNNYNIKHDVGDTVTVFCTNEEMNDLGPLSHTNEFSDVVVRETMDWYCKDERVKYTGINQSQDLSTSLPMHYFIANCREQPTTEIRNAVNNTVTKMNSDYETIISVLLGLQDAGMDWSDMSRDNVSSLCDH